MSKKLIALFGLLLVIASHFSTLHIEMPEIGHLAYGLNYPYVSISYVVEYVVAFFPFKTCLIYGIFVGLAYFVVQLEKR